MPLHENLIMRDSHKKVEIIPKVMAKRKYTYIDLFSGSGGFSLGFDNANFENIFSVEFNHGICETYRHNFPSHTLLECDIADLTETERKSLAKERLMLSSEDLHVKDLVWRVILGVSL